MGGTFQAAFIGAALSVLLSGCLATTDNYVVYEPGTNERMKVSAAKSASATAPAKRSETKPAERLRAELKNICVVKHAGSPGGREKTSRQCDCYAGGMLKTMGKNDLEYYAQYKLIPTLGVARPEDVEKQCGIRPVQSAQFRPGT